MNKTMLSTLAYLAAAVLLVVAVIYFVRPADQLPGFFPGHNQGLHTVHFKHGLAALLLALGVAAFGWFQGGPKTGSAQQ